MASGIYISIDRNKIPAAAERARNLRNHMESTRTSLRVYQKQLDIYVQSMERRFGFCFNDTVPLNALAEQERRMKTIADLFDQAAELARRYDSSLASQTQALQLSVSAMGNMSAYASAVGVIAAGLSGETSVGDDWADVYTEPTHEEIMADMQLRYNALREERGKSYSGVCTAFVYQQLGSLGVITRSVDPSVAEGRQWYGLWSTRSTTTTGYQVNPYSSLDELLNAHSNEYLTNIVLSFNQRPGYYGHSAGHIVLITAIKDGNVYFMDNGTMNSGLYQAETPSVLTIEQFKKCYPYENGVIHYTKAG